MMKKIDVVAAIIIKDGKVFATQRGYGEWQGWWEFPGGKIEEGECPEDALKREIKEELDAEIDIKEFLDTIEWDYPTFHLTMHCYICSIKSEAINLIEHKASAWLSRSSLNSVKWLPADISLLDRVSDHLTKKIYLAGGCFWGTENYLQQFDGIVRTVVGYANGSTPFPTYEQVYTDSTGHVECVEVTYDPDILTLKTLCRLFFKSINPYLLNKQGNDCGTRYRTGIYWTDEDDSKVVEDVFNTIPSLPTCPIVVEKGRLECFYPAEEYHQDYLSKNPDGYCHISLHTLRFARRYTRIIRKLKSNSH